MTNEAWWRWVLFYVGMFAACVGVGYLANKLL